MVELAVRSMLGEALKHGLGYRAVSSSSLYSNSKVPVFSFEKLSDVDTFGTGDEIYRGSTCIAQTIDEALYKGLIAAGYK